MTGADQAVKRDLALAVDLLRREGAGFVLVARGHMLASSRHHGIVPLLDAVEALRDRGGRATALADRVLGRAALLVALAVGVRAAHGETTSDGAVLEAQERGIALSWGARVSAILNRAGTARCPFETALEGCHDPAEAVRLLRAVAARMGASEARG
jgi:hypothetical protein